MICYLLKVRKHGNKIEVSFSYQPINRVIDISNSAIKPVL